MDGEKQADVRAVLAGLLAFLSFFFSAGRTASLYLHTLMPTHLFGCSSSGGMGGREQLACLTVPSRFLPSRPEKFCKYCLHVDQIRHYFILKCGICKSSFDGTIEEQRPASDKA